MPEGLRQKIAHLVSLIEGHVLVRKARKVELPITNTFGVIANKRKMQGGGIKIGLSKK